MTKVNRVDAVAFGDDICGKAYHELLSNLATSAHSFGFKYPWRFKGDRAEVLMRTLSPWLVRADGRPGRRGSRLLTNTYRVTDGSVAVLSHAADCLFDWRLPNLPEDLFFADVDGGKLLESFAHAESWELRLTPPAWETLWASAPAVASWYRTATDAKRRRGQRPPGGKGG